MWIATITLSIQPGYDPVAVNEDGISVGVPSEVGLGTVIASTFLRGLPLLLGYCSISVSFQRPGTLSRGSTTASRNEAHPFSTKTPSPPVGTKEGLRFGS